MRQHIGFGTESEVMFALNDADDSVRVCLRVRVSVRASMNSI